MDFTSEDIRLMIEKGSDADPGEGKTKIKGKVNFEQFIQMMNENWIQVYTNHYTFINMEHSFSLLSEYFYLSYLGLEYGLYSFWIQDLGFLLV